jgi:hypothetical protein
MDAPNEQAKEDEKQKAAKAAAAPKEPRTGLDYATFGASSAARRGLERIGGAVMGVSPEQATQPYTPPEAGMQNLTLQGVQATNQPTATPAIPGYEPLMPGQATVSGGPGVAGTGPAADLATGRTTMWSPAGQAGVPDQGIGLNGPPPPAGATGPTAQDDINQRLAALDAFYAGMRGAPRVAMNEDMRRGIAGQQEAMRGVIGVMEAEGPGKEAARAGMQAEGAKYIQGLEQLRGQQNQDFAARRQQMAQDEAALAQAREQFDPSRTLREIGKSPVSTGALTFAAGLVGMLKGSAGQYGPNEILQEVDKAVERDTKAQMQRYDMLVQGIQTGRSNFGDLMKMGASQQEALAMTAMASMDQHKRALEFAQQRVAGAKEKGALKEAISQLDFQRGKLQLDIDMKNAANYVSMNRARGEGMAKMIELRQKMAGMDPETQKLAFSQYESLTKSPDFSSAKSQLEAVGRMRALQREIPLNKQKELWDSVVWKTINSALTETEAKSTDSGAIATAAIARVLGAAVKDMRDPEQIKMLNFAQRLVNTELKNISGGSVTSGEAVRNAMTRNFSTFQGFSDFMNTQQEEARNGLRVAKTGAATNPYVKTMLDTVLLPAEDQIAQYEESLRAREEAKKGAQ